MVCVASAQAYICCLKEVDYIPRNSDIKSQKENVPEVELTIADVRLKYKDPAGALLFH